jgi:uncharacterized small protein (DUF1192 family)
MTEDVAAVKLRPKEFLIENPIISLVSCLELYRRYGILTADQNHYKAKLKRFLLSLKNKILLIKELSTRIFVKRFGIQ